MKLDKNNFSEWYNSILELADIVDLRYPVKGMPVYKGWGFSILRNCFRVLEDRLNSTGHQEMLFPLLIPDDQFGKEAEHIKGFEEQVLWATHAGLERMERKLAVRPTSETIMYPMFAIWVRSHADLPLRVHQTVCVYRYETKATKPLVRGREIYWNEAHTAHASMEDAERQVQEGFRTYSEFYRNVGIPFMALKRPDYDKFAGAEYSIALDVLMPDRKVLQIGTVHNLGQNFSKVYGIYFDDETGEKKLAYQTTYGLSMRCLAAIISVHGDDKGLFLPPLVAPIQVVIVPIFFGDKEGILKKCRDILGILTAMGIRAKVDETDARPGDKFYFWEGKGVPVRIEIGPKDIEKHQVMMALRSGTKKAVGENNLAVEIEKSFDEITKHLLAKAEKELKENANDAKDFDELKKILEKKHGFTKAGWCGSEECADEIKKATTAEIRGEEYPSKNEKRECVVCNKSGVAVWIAKAY